MAWHKRLAAGLSAWIVFADEAGQALRPAKGATWARRGVTPRLIVAGRSNGRINLAGMIAIRPGCRSRFLYRMTVSHSRRGGARSINQYDLARMLDGVHQHLGRAPIVLVWDNDMKHRSKLARQLLAARPWLTVFHLPAYSPALNPVEGAWSVLKRSLANLAPLTIDDLAHLVTCRLRTMQRRTDGLIDGFIIHTGLNMQPP